MEERDEYMKNMAMMGNGTQIDENNIGSSFSAVRVREVQPFLLQPNTARGRKRGPHGLQWTDISLTIGAWRDWGGNQSQLRQVFKSIRDHVGIAGGRTWTACKVWEVMCVQVIIEIWSTRKTWFKWKDITFTIDYLMLRNLEGGGWIFNI